MPELPSGTVTFLFSDIEGSTRMLREFRDGYPAILERHQRLLVEAVERHGGQVFGTEGDAVFAAFSKPASALLSAVDAQRGLASAEWPEGAGPRVRMGVHTGEVTLAGDNYVGLTVHHVARLTSAGHGGQILVSEATRQLSAEALPDGAELRDLGEHRLKDLGRPERIHQLVVPDLTDQFPGLRTMGGRASNLPPQLTSFVGRAELAEAERLLSGARLLTLTGPGGTGKTRMAIEVAARAGDAHADGAFFVALDAVTDPGLVASSIATALDLAETSDPPLEGLMNNLRDRELLLVLDNLEQVIDVGPIISRLLRDAPRLRIIATSRVPLRISGEQEFGVPPLSVPDADASVTASRAARSEAVRLFVERAMAVQPAFQLTDDNAADVVDVVRRLDGLPLAIELAAARTRILPPPALRARLDQRLGLLVGGKRDLPARQQTLRGAIDWSHDLLDRGEQLIFARFAVFAGGAWLTQAEQVCGPATDLDGEVLDIVSSLVEKSLVRSLAMDDAEPRFGMLATIRDYALEKLASSGEAGALQRRHAEACLALFEGCAPGLTGGRSRQLLDRLEPDHDNLRAALDWAVASGEATIALRLVAAVWRYWQIRGHLHEAQERIDRVLNMAGLDEVPADLMARALGAAGGVAYWRGDEQGMNDHYQAALEHARRSDDPALLADALYNSGYAKPLGGEIAESDLSAAMAAFEESRGLYEALGDRSGVANAVWAMALGSFVVRDFDQARRRLLESLEIYRSLDNRFGLGWSTYMLGAAELLTDGEAALGRMHEALDIFVGTGDKSGIALAIGAIGLIAQRQGDAGRAWRLFGAVEGLQRTAGVALAQAPNQPDDIRIPSAPPADDEVARLAWDEGLTLRIDDAVEFAFR